MQNISKQIFNKSIVLATDIISIVSTDVCIKHRWNQNFAFS